MDVIFISCLLPALAVLNVIAETCSASQEALRQTQSSQAVVPALAILRKDFTSLLTFLYTLTTKITLTLRPSEQAFAASLAPMHDLTKYISSLTTCATLFDSYGKTLSEDVRRGSQDVLESLKAFAFAFTSIIQQGEASDADYLVRTGAVHDSIDSARKKLPEDNLAAVRSRWAQDRAMLEDSLGEVGDMTEQGEEEEADEDFGDEFDGEWDELGLGSAKRLNPQELARTKQVCALER